MQAGLRDRSTRMDAPKRNQNTTTHGLPDKDVPAVYGKETELQNGDVGNSVTRYGAQGMRVAMPGYYRRAKA